MNERIKELELEAAYGVIDPNGPFTPEEFNNFTAKFAELIIRKCAEVAWYNTPDWEELEYGHLIEDKILKHFGVEE